VTSQQPVSVDCRPLAGGWTCTVAVGDDPGRTTHVVMVSTADLERFAPGEHEPTGLVAASFEFLLAREPRGSILRSFDLPVIGTYFPEYPAEIGRVMTTR
jgi:hypothetical protein